MPRVCNSSESDCAGPINSSHTFEPRDYLRHIMVEADYLLAQRAGLTFEAFAANDTLRRDR